VQKTAVGGAKNGGRGLEKKTLPWKNEMKFPKQKMKLFSSSTIVLINLKKELGKRYEN
jgi:hypothetical protein